MKIKKIIYSLFFIFTIFNTINISAVSLKSYKDFVINDFVTKLKSESFDIKSESFEDIEKFAEFLNNFKYEDKRKIVGELIKKLNPKKADTILEKIDECKKEGFKILDLSSSDITSKQLALLLTLIQDCKKLAILGLSFNKIKEIPAEIVNLKKLAILDLSKNEITEIPTQISNLKNLRGLGLSSNKITKIPKSIGNLINLIRFYIYDNKITEISKSIRNLTNLIKLYLRDNPLSKKSRKILKTMEEENKRITIY